MPQPRRRAGLGNRGLLAPSHPAGAGLQAEASGEPVAMVKPQVRSHAHRGATDYGKWDAFVADDSDRMASEPRDDRNASARVRGSGREWELVARLQVFLFL